MRFPIVNYRRLQDPVLLIFRVSQLKQVTYPSNPAVFVPHPDYVHFSPTVATELSCLPAKQRL